MAKMVNTSTLLGSVCIGAFVAVGVVQAQEVKNSSSATAATATVTAVSQQQLNNAHKDGTNFLQHQRQLRADPVLPERANQPWQCLASASGLDLLDRS